MFMEQFGLMDIYCVTNIEWCEFNTNKADVGGGAVGVEENVLNINMSEFSYSKVGQSDSGAVLPCNVTTNVGVCNHTAEGYGGAIMVVWSYVRVSNSHFTTNEAYIGGGVVSTWGGAVDFDSFLVTIVQVMVGQCCFNLLKL